MNTLINYKKLMNHGAIIYISSIGIPLLSFFFLRKYMDKEKSWRYIMGASVAITALIYIYICIIDKEKKSILYLNMLIPVYAPFLYKGMRKLFIKRFGREPVDTSFEYHVTFPDVMFNLLYALLITVVPIFIVLYIVS
jgi:hypothetical protein